MTLNPADSMTSPHSQWTLNSSSLTLNATSTLDLLNQSSSAKSKLSNTDLINLVSTTLNKPSSSEEDNDNESNEPNTSSFYTVVLSHLTNIRVGMRIIPNKIIVLRNESKQLQILAFKAGAPLHNTITRSLSASSASPKEMIEFESGCSSVLFEGVCCLFKSGDSDDIGVTFGELKSNANDASYEINEDTLNLGGWSDHYTPVAAATTENDASSHPLSKVIAHTSFKIFNQSIANIKTEPDIGLSMCAKIKECLSLQPILNTAPESILNKCMKVEGCAWHVVFQEESSTTTSHILDVLSNPNNFKFEAKFKFKKRVFSMVIFQDTDRLGRKDSDGKSGSTFDLIFLYRFLMLSGMLLFMWGIGIRSYVCDVSDGMLNDSTSLLALLSLRLCEHTSKLNVISGGLVFGGYGCKLYVKARDVNVKRERQSRKLKAVGDNAKALGSEGKRRSKKNK